MKIMALRFTLQILCVPILLTLISYYFLANSKLSFQDLVYILSTDFIVLLTSGILTFFILLKSNKNKEVVLEKLKKSNDSIRISNERYDIVAKATSDSIWDWNLLDKSFVWNKGIQGVFGYKKNEIEGTFDWWIKKIHPEDRSRMTSTMERFIQLKTERWQDQYRFECKDGSYKYILDRGFLVTDTFENPIRMIGAMQDITKQKIEEERLKLLETVITKTKDAIIITNANVSENNNPKIIYVNPAFAEMTGYKSNEVLGKSINSYLETTNLEEKIKNYPTETKSKKEISFESLNKRKNGDDYWANLSLIPVENADGDNSHWIAIQREITDEKNQEKEKEQLIGELLQNNSDLKQFSYITSHNLRAPLSNLTGLLFLLDDIEILDPELIEILSGFRISTNLLNETVNDLIKVIIIKDSPSVSKEEISVQDTLNSLQIQIQNLILKAQPEILLQVHKLPVLFTNKSYFESILLNLLTNSLKYRSEKRSLKIDITTAQTTTHYQLTYEDNGIGINMELNKDKIFGLYQRFHDFPDSKGLGLYLVKSQIESLGGTIQVESQVDKGTKFTIMLKK